MQRLKSNLLRTQGLKILPLKSGVGQYIAIHATLTARKRDSREAGIACWLERRTRDRKVASSNPGRTIFFSRVNLVC